MTVHPMLMFALIAGAFTIGALCWGHSDNEDRAANDLERQRLESWAAHLVRADISRGQRCTPAECARRTSALQACQTELDNLRDAINELPTDDVASISGTSTQEQP